MQRSPSLTVLVHCPHHQRNVRAVRNTAIDRLVSCEESEACRTPPSDGGKAFPHACPVYPSLAR